MILFTIFLGNVLVIGSQSPWIEGILIGLGATKITTLEYSQLFWDHPYIKTVTPQELNKQVRCVFNSM